MTADEAMDKVKVLDQARNLALLSEDSDVLETLLSDDYVHIHAGGRLDDRATWLREVFVDYEFLRVERPALQVRVHGTTAVATGVLEMTVRAKSSGKRQDARLMTTMVWIEKGNRWLLHSYQAGEIL